MSWHEIINVILFNIKPILRITVLATIFLALIFLFVYPQTFQSNVTILPPEKNSQLSGLSALIGSSELNSIVSGGSSSATPQLYGEILKSRTAALYVIEKLNLINYLEAKNKYEAAEKLNKKINLDISKEGIIELNVDVTSSFIPLLFSDQNNLKNLSSKISNTFVEALDKINREKNSSRARNAREYIEEQLIQTRIKLDSAETSLLKFQKVNKAISLPDQVEVALRNASEIKSEIIKTEIEIGLLNTNSTEDSRAYKSLEKKLETLKSQYSKFEFGSKDYMLAFKDIPEMGKELASILREVKIQNEVYILLQQQYYKEKIQENRDMPTVQILDEAVPPRKASAPRALLSTIIGGIIVFIFMSLTFIVQTRKNSFLIKSK